LKVRIDIEGNSFGTEERDNFVAPLWDKGEFIERLSIGVGLDAFLPDYYGTLSQSKEALCAVDRETFDVYDWGGAQALQGIQDMLTFLV